MDTSNAYTITADTITDPVIPFHYEMDYDSVITFPSGVFAEGVRGMGFIQVFIDQDCKIRWYVIQSVRLRDSGVVVYNYPADKGRSETRELDKLVGDFIKRVTVRRSNGGEVNGIEGYTLPVKIN